MRMIDNYDGHAAGKVNCGQQYLSIEDTRMRKPPSFGHLHYFNTQLYSLILLAGDSFIGGKVDIDWEEIYPEGSVKSDHKTKHLLRQRDELKKSVAIVECEQRVGYKSRIIEINPLSCLKDCYPSLLIRLLLPRRSDSEGNKCPAILQLIGFCSS